MSEPIDTLVDLALTSVPEFYDELEVLIAAGLLEDTLARNEFCTKLSWAVPERRSVELLSRFFKDSSKLLELGSGLGLWSKLIEYEGVRPICFDIVDTSVMNYGYFDKDSKPFNMSITCYDEGMYRMLQFNQGADLFMCWPSYDQAWAYNYLSALKPKKFAYIGESKGGCCADDDFFDALSDSYILVDHMDICSWAGIHDNLHLYERK